MQDFLHGTGVTVLYILIAAPTAILARVFIKIPNELFRKILHCILLGIYVPLVTAYTCWQHAAIFALALTVLVFPILLAVSRLPAFAGFMVERRRGEYVNSMVLALTMMAVSTTICWGLAGERLFVIACIWAWGIGDAFAALIGKRFGRHKITWRFADKNKSLEGSAAMFVCSFTSTALILPLTGTIAVHACIGIALLAAAACTVAELCSKNGYDTVICPAAAMLVILPLAAVFGG